MGTSLISLKEEHRKYLWFPLFCSGRQIADSVTAVGVGVDDALLRIERSYDVRGLLESVTSFDAAAGGNVVNQVKYEYNDAGLLYREYEEHQGAVDANSLFVEYAYDADRRYRLASVEDQNGRIVHYTYGSAGSADDNLNRLAAICDDDRYGGPGQVLAAYSYLGLGGIVVEDCQQAEVKLDLWGGTTGAYSGLDRFNRVIDQLWTDYGADPDATLDEFLYTYDRVGNRLSRDNALHAAFDEDYTYDGLDRLLTSDRADGYDQSWTLDGLGNWSEYDDDGTAQARETNDFNEITDITGGWVTPEYDRAGNMIYGPQAGDETTSLHYVYDAWNRQVAIYQDDGDGVFEPGTDDDLVADYQYDGANRRTVKTLADGSSVEYYYNQQWQTVEERFLDDESALTAVNQYVWSARCVDSPVVRFHDGNADGDLLDAGDNVRYYTTDANANVTALLDADGTVVERYAYTPYGEATVYSPTWTDPAAATGDGPLYCGYWFDAETGTYHVRAREYHPTLGAFTARDPLGFSAGDPNLYAYCGGNPLARTDPSGRLVVRPTSLLEGGFFDCPFPHTDPSDPNGFYVALPGGGEPVWFPQWAIIVAPITEPAWCEICGAYEGGYGYYDPSTEMWNLVFATGHYIGPHGWSYSPGPSGYSDNYWDILFGRSRWDSDLRIWNNIAYGMIGTGAGGLGGIFFGTFIAGSLAPLIGCESAGIIGGFSGSLTGKFIGGNIGQFGGDLGRQIGEIGGAIFGGMIEPPCFAAGTPIMTPDGAKPIEQLRAGNLVLSSPEGDADGPVSPQRVQEVFERSSPLYDIQVGGRLIRTTPEHPFYVQNKGWTAAISLVSGDLLRSHDGQWVAVESACLSDEVAPVYNLRVEECHTYFVGSEQWGFSVWVHNSCNGPNQREIDQVTKEIDDLQGKIDSIERASQEQIDKGGIGEGYNLGKSYQDLWRLYTKLAELIAQGGF